MSGSAGAATCSDELAPYEQHLRGPVAWPDRFKKHDLRAAIHCMQQRTQKSLKRDIRSIANDWMVPFMRASDANGRR